MLTHSLKTKKCKSPPFCQQKAPPAEKGGGEHYAFFSKNGHIYIYIYIYWSRVEYLYKTKDLCIQSTRAYSKKYVYSK